MREDNVARAKAFLEWLQSGTAEGIDRAEAILRQPASEWSRWLAAHPEAAAYHTFQSLLQVATDDPRARAIAELVLAHAGQARLPEGAGVVRRSLVAHAWKVHGQALREAGDLRGALRSYEHSIEAFRVPPSLPDAIQIVEQHAAAVRRQLEHEESLHAVVERLLDEVPYASWQELAERRELLDAAALHALSRQFNARIHHQPLEALAVTRLAVAVAEALAEKEELRPLAAEAWRDHATALRMLARYEDSLAAFDRAEQLLPRSGQELVRANIGMARGSTLQEAGRFAEAISLLRECRRVFERYGDRRGQLFSGISEGALLHRTERYPEARDRYLALLPLAEELGDLDALGSIHNNLGHAAIELGDFALAEPHLAEAVRLFAEIGLPLQVARAELARGRLMIRKGEIERGIDDLHRVRAIFLRHNLVEEAGLCGLDVVEAHLASGRPIEAEAFARQIVREFTAALLNARAITALRYLSEAIAARKASGTTVRDVQAFIRSLRANPELEFEAAS